MPTDDQRRYSAHHALAQVGAAGQQKISASSMVLVGLGGLGCAAAPYLAAAGVRRLQLCDFDTVAESNLARQVLYTPDDVGQAKVAVAARRLAQLNPNTRIEAFDKRVDEDCLRAQFGNATVILDASDNYGTRLAVNRACLATGTPWVMGACIRFEGQLALFEPARPDSPCYRCIYGQAPDQLEDCPGAGVFSTVAAMVGSAMAHVALLMAAGLSPAPGLRLLDGQALDWRTIGSGQRADCPDCGGRLTRS
ncbi:MAG: HesA/MoeB/ThiF family protein [Xanthomonadales bacterium]|nr:HesA/MoeB/ThiF family protein [Xanthomonadales bacterium]